MIDQVLVSYGLDPVQCTDRSGWRWLGLGSANGAVGVVEMHSNPNTPRRC
jgi:hypothetical protein